MMNLLVYLSRLSVRNVYNLELPSVLFLCDPVDIPKVRTMHIA
jgi:hypothetical protein